jgi:DNA-directed RNA polymerase specialized sigma24 family protein
MSTVGQMDHAWRDSGSRTTVASDSIVRLVARGADTDEPPQPPSDLLSILDSDPRQAEARFDELRRQLVRFLEWQKCDEPEDAAREALARGLKRIAGGVDTSTAGARGYFFGIAKNLVKEGWRSRKEALLDPADWERQASARQLEHVEARRTLSTYLRHLSRLERTLIVRYYTEDRVALCRELGMTGGSLRVTVHRIRRKLDVQRSEQRGQ